MAKDGIDANTIAEAKEEAVDSYSAKNIETEKLSDGWLLTFENKGSMGVNYFVNVRRKIGDKDYWCSTTASKVEQKKAVIAACKSLKK